MRGNGDRNSGEQSTGGGAAGERQLPDVDAVSQPYRHVYLSPHFDDVALSAGGLALLQRRRREPVLVVGVFTAPPPDALTGFARYQHAAWGGASDPWAEREAEERAAMAALGADYLWLGYPDAIYRGDQYLSDDDLFGPVKSGDAALAGKLADDAVRLWRRCAGAVFYLPLGVGNHVDHQICCAVAPRLEAAGAEVAFYEDSPYALDPEAVTRRLRALGRALRPEVVELGPAIEQKVAAVLLYRSQVPWVFRHHGEAGDAIRRHAARLSRVPGGHAERLWRHEKRGEA